jgi:hypothetical protein
MPKRKSLHQAWYPEGGGCTKWVTDEGESSHSEGPGPDVGGTGKIRPISYGNYPKLPWPVREQSVEV